MFNTNMELKRINITLSDLSSGDVSRFWRKVEKSEGCWKWIGNGFTNGYGQFFVRVGGVGRTMLAHRVSFLVNGGEFSDLKPCILHRCDNRICVNPHHLFQGTKSENTQDMLKKGRSNYSNGINRPMHKVNDDAVREMRRMYSDGGITTKELGFKFSLSCSHVSKIIRGKKWRHVV